MSEQILKLYEITFQEVEYRGEKKSCTLLTLY